MRIVVFTTSYPRHPDDFAGRFVSDVVERLRDRGLDVDVVGPGTYRDYGLGEGGRGVVAQLRRRPFTAPLLFVSMARTLRQAARGADLVHAHWLAGALVAAFAGRPFVVTLHGSISAGRLDDFALARRAPRLVGLALRRARAVLCDSQALAEGARRAGARNVVVVPNGVNIPDRVYEEAEPPYILYAGRLAPEKGIQDLVPAAAGLPLRIVGDGPLRTVAPDALPFVPRDEFERLMNGAAIVVCPSRQEGFGVTCAEAMAHGRPVVASAVGGLLDLVRDGETGLRVPPGDRVALRAALERLLGDRALRLRLGAQAREHITELCDWDRVIDRTIAVYRSALD